MGFESPYGRHDSTNEAGPQGLEELELVSHRLRQMNESLGIDQGYLNSLSEEAAIELRRVVGEVTKPE